MTDFIPVFGNIGFTLAAFLVALSVIVAVHEYGHYIVGRWCGIHAEVFSLGFGPVLCSRTDRRGTRWQVAAIPLGGYVRFLGDANAASAAADDATMARLSQSERRHTMHGAPLWARAATVAAGPIFNFILSFLIFAGYVVVGGVATDRPVIAALHPLPEGAGGLQPGDTILAVGGQATPDWTTLAEASDRAQMQGPTTYLVARDGQEMTVDGPALTPARVEQILPGTAAVDGIRKGDVIVALDGKAIDAFSDIRAHVTEGQGKPIRLDVWREGQTLQLDLTPRKSDLPLAGGGFETRYLLGLDGSYFFTPATRTATPYEVASGAARSVWFQIRTSLSALGHVVVGAISPCTVRGPITIAKTSGFVATQGAENFIWFLAALSTGIGLMNLFPIPLLDGGHLVFHAWEWATGKPLPERVLTVALSIGLFVVIAFMAFGLSNDLFCA